MDAPGSGGKNWNYGKDHHWTYQEADGSLHTGWLYDKGEWYWFDERGWLQTGGQRDIDGVQMCIRDRCRRQCDHFYYGV